MFNLKINRPLLYAAIAVVGVGIYLSTEPSVTRKGAPRRNASASAASNLPEGFTQQDLTAKFERSTGTAKNAFQPLIARQAGAETAAAPDAVPTILTAGESGWYYTGMAEVDGIPTGLLENRSTGEGVFLKQSEKWKDATVRSISPFVLILVGSNGKSYTLRVSELSGTPQMLAQGYAPVSPQLQGRIGNDLEVRPTRDGRSAGVNPSNSMTEARDGEN